MGLLNQLRLAREAISMNIIDFPVNRAGQAGIVSPWSEGSVQQFVWNDIIAGSGPVPVTRAEAMSLPAVAVGRARIIGALAGRPLRAIRAGEIYANQPSWLYRTDGDTPLWHRMAHTLDDMMFYGHSLWAVKRGDGSQIIDAVRVPYDLWEIDSNYNILINKVAVDSSEVIYFPGTFEGLLNVGARTIRAAINLENAWSGRAASPSPAIVLEEREDHGMEQEEAKAYVDAVAKARLDPNGAVMFVPYKINARFEGATATDLMIEARNAVKLDIANFLNLDAADLDAALPKASLNYETQDGREKSFEARLPYWTGAIEARLSMDDVCPRGQRIAFDMSSNTIAPGGATGPFAED